MGKLIIDRNLANSMSINVSELLFDVDTRSFAKNIAESCALHQKYNTSITTSIYDEIKAINLIYITIQTEEINNFLKEICTGKLHGIVEYSEEEIVSSDIVGNSHSGIIDALSTEVVASNLVKLVIWYDNEWGFSNRMVEVIKTIGKK